MKKIIYIILVFLLAFLSLLRIDMRTNLDTLGFVHKEVPPFEGIVINMFPFGYLEGYSGSMSVFVLICVIVGLLLYVNFKLDANNKMRTRLFLTLFSVSLLIFEETLIRLLGIIILTILIYGYVSYKDVIKR